MCIQPRQPCMNRLCSGFAQTLEPSPCRKRPNCTIEKIPIQQSLRSKERYCPECRLTTPQQRATNRLRESRRASSETWREKAKRVKALEGQANGAVKASSNMKVKQIAESSMMAPSRGAVGGGFHPNSASRLSFSEESHSKSSRLVGPDPMWYTDDDEQYQQEMRDLGFGRR